MSVEGNGACVPVAPGAERGGEPEPIAVIGIGCRFPGGANSPAAFWQLLREGRDAITPIPADRWRLDKFYDPEPGTPGRTAARYGGFLEQVDAFDAHFFGISAREAAHMDPQQRLLLEVAWEALEDGGQVLEQLAGGDTGVFIGVSGWDYSQLQTGFRDYTGIDVYSNTGSALSIIANRLSYCFHFRGPSIAVDTACSSALVAVHLACESLRRGESSLALAGGVNVLLAPQAYIGFSRLAMLSPDGRCKAFDAHANGFVRSEGAGVVVLKPLAQALADGDRVYALIRGTAVNQDGRTSGMTVPSEESQLALVRTACRRAGVAPAQIQYVEAHGTGTLVGDPIEARALGAALAEGRRDGAYCRVGSVKSNIGHCEPASGIAGLIKTVLALHHRQIPANLHFQVPNPEIPFEQLRLCVPRSLEAWPQPSEPALAGVNSFGFGGTNAHAIVQEAPSWPVMEPGGQGGNGAPISLSPCLLPLSARSSEALQALAGAYAELLEGAGADTRLEDLVFTASTRRSHHEHRLALVTHSRADLAEQLRAVAKGELPAGASRDRAGACAGLAFVFSGQGPQWWAMGRQLLAEEPVFRQSVQRCDEAFAKLACWSLLEELTATEERSRMHDPEIGQSALFAIQVALAELWQAWGVHPEAVVGHSLGEVAAAHVAGALSLTDAVHVIFHRSRCMGETPLRGKMLAVGLAVAEAQELLHGREAQAVIATINGPKSLTLAGDEATLAEVAQELDRRQVFCRFLKVDFAFHSHHMEPVKDALLASLAGIQPRPATIPLFSSVTGRRVDGSALDADYWWQNVRRPVVFADAVERLIADNYRLLVEISPHPVLAAAIGETAQSQGQSVRVLPSLRRREPERAMLLQSLGALYAQGQPVDWKRLAPPDGRFVRVPSYPWQHERFWHESEESREARLGPPGHPLLGSHARAPYWEQRLDRRLLAYLDDHRVQGNVLLPAAAFVEMALTAACAAFPTEPRLLEAVKLTRACFLPDGAAPTLQMILNPSEAVFTIGSRAATGDRSWTAHVSGVLAAALPEAPGEPCDLEAIRKRCPTEIAGAACYALFRELGLEYGPTFQGIERLWQGDGEALAAVRVPDRLTTQLEVYQFHPALLDACFQVILGSVAGGTGCQPVVQLYLPVEIEEVRCYGRPGSAVWCHARLVEKTRREMVADVAVFDEAGKLLLEVRGLRSQAISESGGLSSAVLDLLYEYQWQLQPRPATASAARPAAGLLSGPLLEDVRAEAQRLFEQQELEQRLLRIEGGVNRLCTAYVWNALQQLGAAWQPGEPFTSAVLAERLGIDPVYQRLLDRYLHMLAEDGVLESAGPQWRFRRPPEPVNVPETWRMLLNRNPASIAELTLIRRCGERLAEVLRGEIPPLQLIFPEGSLAISEHLYTDSPFARFLNTVAQVAVARLLERLPEGRPIRILEIGAGTGGLTSHVLPRLPAERTTYCFTDLSSLFFGKARQKFADYAFVEYQKLDIEKPPAEQGFAEHSFDLVLASQVLHATADLRATLAHARRLLASGGVLLLTEMVQPPRWLDLVFGLTPGWWRFSDFDLRPAYPLLSTSQWLKLLQEEGFSRAADVTRAADAKALLYSVILAQGPVLEDADAAPAIVSSPEPGRWLLWADQAGRADWLAERLRERGDHCTLLFAGAQFERHCEERCTIRPDSREDLEEVLQRLLGPGKPVCRGLVHLWNLDAPAAEGLSTTDLENAQTAGCSSVVHLVQAWSQLAAAPPACLWLVTRGARAVGTTAEPVAIAQAPLLGLGRVLQNEWVGLDCKRVDLSATVSEAELQALLAELWAPDEEDEIALRGAARYVHRYVQTTPDQQRDYGQSSTRPETAYRLEIGRPGSLDGLTLRAVERRTPAAGEVEIQVRAASLNFSDVMKALGLYPGLPDGPVPLGIECSGVITAVGADVRDFQIGDAVLGIAPFSFGSHVVTSALCVAPRPAALSFEEAATIPVAYLTAYYALDYLGHLSAGERVLIHSAAGGVGLAAIQLAHELGAEVWATAGTAEKREFLQSLGVAHVLDSRTLAFADEVMKRTGRRGVDVVLNSLSGEAIARGLSVLADHGRFLEIGKRDIYQNSRVGLKPFRKNLSFLAIDLDRAMKDRPAPLAALFRKLVADVGAGVIAPLPYRVFSIANAIGAFRYMAQGKHIGKIVVSLQERPAAIAPAPAQPFRFQSNGTYLITGGLGGFGLTVARWLVEQGARHLVLMGRRGAASPETENAVAALRQAGAEVVVARADVADPEQLAGVLAQLRQQLPPLRGVFHAAMVLEDGLLLNLTPERWRRVLAPKMNGAWNLHCQTRDLPLDCFVLFSSMSSVFGVAGQANYAAANTFLDALAWHRRALGLPGLTINWGYLGEVGYVARNEKVSERFVGQGGRSFSPAEALTLLGALLQHQAVQMSVQRLDWRFWRGMGLRDYISPRFRQLCESGSSATAQPTTDGLPTRQLILTSSAEQRGERLTVLLRDKVARVLGESAAKLDVQRPLTDLGLDSLMAVELRNWIESELRVNLPVVELMRGPSVAQLAASLLGQLCQEERQHDNATARPGDREPRPVSVSAWPLSHGQRALWRLQQQAPESGANNEAFILYFGSEIDSRRIEETFRFLVQRHPMLRVVFREQDGQVTQVVQEAPEGRLEVVDATDWSAGQLQAEMVAEAHRPFDLEHGPVQRWKLFRRGPEDHVLVLTAHHLVFDIWSMVLMAGELEIVSRAARAGQPPELPPLKHRFVDFVRWQTELLAGPSGERLWSYWRTQLAGELRPVPLPLDRPRPPVRSFRGATWPIELSADLTHGLKELARHERTTLFAVLLAGLQVWLHRSTGQPDVLVGSRTAGRSRPEWEGVVGFFANPLALRADLSGNPPVRSFLGQVRETVHGALEHQDYPFGLLAERLFPECGPGQPALCNVVFVLHKLHLSDASWQGSNGAAVQAPTTDPTGARMTMIDTTVRAAPLEHHVARHDLEWEMYEAEGVLRGWMRYDTDLFEQASIARMTAELTSLLEDMVRCPEKRLAELSLEGTPLQAIS